MLGTCTPGAILAELRRHNEVPLPNRLAGSASQRRASSTWVAFAFLKDWIPLGPNWLFESVIGIILASAATIFGLLRATGIFG